MQVPQWAGPIPMGRMGGPGPSAMSGGWGHGTDYFLGPRIPVLNWQVVVEIHVYVSRAILILYRVIVHYHRYLNKIA